MQPLQQHPQQQPAPMTYVIVQQPAQQVTPVYVSAQPAGQFVGGFLAVGSKVCGALMVVMGIICIGGAMAESIYTATELSDFYHDDGEVLTWNEYAGYWCGILIIAAGAVAAEAGRRPTDALIISSLVGAVVGVTFACTLLGLSAYVFDTDVIRDDVLYGCYVTMVIGASFALMLSLAISALCLKAIICRKPAAKSAGQVQMTTVQSHPHQQQQSYNEYQTGMFQQQQQYSQHNSDFVTAPPKYEF